MNKIIYRDVEHEERTRKELAISRDAMQKVLNEYLSLRLGPCMGLNDLVLRPRAVFDRAVNDMIKVPELAGPFKLNPAQYKEQLVLPDPATLYEACKRALQLPYCAMYGIFIVNDDQVEIDADGANELINSQNIYCNDPKKIKRIRDFLKVIDILNDLNKWRNGEALPGNPWTINFWRGMATLEQESFPGISHLVPDLEFLKSLAQ